MAAAREEAERQIEAEKQAIKDAEAEAKRQAEEERLNAPAKEIEELSEIAGSLSENSINSIYGRSYSYIDGIKVDEYDYFSNEYSTFREETGDGWGSYNDYPKYFSLNETENGVIATTQIDSYSYSCDDRAENCGLYNNPTKYTSKSIKKNPDGLISFVMTNPGSSRAIKVMLGAGQIDDYNSTYYSYQDYGIWQYGKMQNGEFVPTVGIDALNNYAVLYNKNGNSDLIRESSQRSDILDNVVFTGKTNAVKTQRYEGTSQELSGNVKLTLGFQDKSENYAYNPKANIELDFKDWKKISFDANTNNHNYSGYFDISNVKINDVETPVNGTLKMNFDKVAEHSARIGGIEIPNVVVNEYDKATGVYGFQGILDGDSTEVVGGFVSKAIDDNNRFAVAPDIYYY